MATNADTTDDDNDASANDLRDLKYGTATKVDTSDEADEQVADTKDDDDTASATGEDADTNGDQTDDDTKADTEDDSDLFVKEFPSIKGENLEDYARSLEIAYKNSTSEALRLKKLVDGAATKDTDIGDAAAADEVDISDPIALFMKQKMDEEITNAYTEFAKQYPQVTDQVAYNKFTHEVETLSKTILQSQKRLAPPAELYSKAAIILGWEPDESSGKVTGKEKLKIALKDSAAESKVISAAGKRAAKSKVTDAMMAANRKMYPHKSDQEIRDELEPYVQ